MTIGQVRSAIPLLKRCIDELVSLNVDGLTKEHFVDILRAHVQHNR